MAECRNCNAETQPGDLITRLVDEEYFYFCSESCYAQFTSPKPKAAMPSEDTPSDRPAPPPAVRKPSRKKASPKA